MHIRNINQLKTISMQPSIKSQVERAFDRMVKEQEDKKKKKSKFRNVKVEVDGILFDSKLEAQGYIDLKAMKLVGMVLKFERQVPYEIKMNDKKMCTYRADFVVTFNNHIEVWDYKGFKTQVYRLKKKLVEEQYQIKIIEKYARKKKTQF